MFHCRLRQRTINGDLHVQKLQNAIYLVNTPSRVHAHYYGTVQHSTSKLDRWAGKALCMQHTTV